MSLFPLIGSPVDVQSERAIKIPEHIEFPVDQELIERQERAGKKEDNE